MLEGRVGVFDDQDRFLDAVVEVVEGPCQCGELARTGGAVWVVGCQCAVWIDGRGRVPLTCSFGGDESRTGRYRLGPAGERDVRWRSRLRLWTGGGDLLTSMFGSGNCSKAGDLQKRCRS
jgi:hypothetical protein